jgi:hypothetical protein
MTHPILNRTSPKGQLFVGTCPACSMTGLTLQAMQEECPNQRGMTWEVAVLEAVQGSQESVSSTDK